MAKAKQGDKVKVHYTGTLEDGAQFDSSEGREPLEFVLGEGMVIEGFEKAVTGLEPGESVSVSIPPEEAYGQRNEELIFRVQRSQMPPDLTPEQGMILEVQTEHGPAQLTVVELEEEVVTLDGNPPLAGKTLNFELSLVEIG
ncbi:MAG: peptidylprolyl isomerase [Desulfovibrio sp.]|jgi:peptidylprolyl isomerase|nr:peptidylprolyl isomerase [Desulfovibrio sp.]